MGLGLKSVFCLKNRQYRGISLDFVLIYTKKIEYFSVTVRMYLALGGVV